MISKATIVNFDILCDDLEAETDKLEFLRDESFEVFIGLQDGLKTGDLGDTTPAMALIEATLNKIEDILEPAADLISEVRALLDRARPLLDPKTGEIIVVNPEKIKAPAEKKLKKVN